MTSTVLLPDRRGPSTERPGSPPAVVVRKAQRRRHVDGLLSLVVLGSVVLVVLALLGWDLSGGRVFVMETPSMCPTVCVGSLVGDRPLQGKVHLGELITFHPPDASAETYTHEISHIFANGMIQTRGVAGSGHDPWLITRSDIVGEVVFNVWGLGWLLRALPFLAIGVLAWVLARPWVRKRTRRTWDRAWMTAVVVLPLWTLHPLVRGSVISITLDRAHRTSATVVNTGILPVSFRSASGQLAWHVRPTDLVHLSAKPSASGYLVLHEAVSLYWWGWVIVALVVASPLAGYLWHIWRDDEAEPEPATA